MRYIPFLRQICSYGLKQLIITKTISEHHYFFIYIILVYISELKYITLLSIDPESISVFIIVFIIHSSLALRNIASQNYAFLFFYYSFFVHEVSASSKVLFFYFYVL